MAAIDECKQVTDSLNHTEMISTIGCYGVLVSFLLFKSHRQIVNGLNQIGE